MSYKIVEIPLNIGIGIDGFTPEIFVLKFEVDVVCCSPLIPKVVNLPRRTIFGPPINKPIFLGPKNRESSPHKRFIEN